MPAPEEGGTFSFSIVHLPLGLPSEIAVRITVHPKPNHFRQKQLGLAAKTSGLESTR